MKTIVSHDQFKPITIGDNLVVNYNRDREQKKCNSFLFFATFIYQFAQNPNDYLQLVHSLVVKKMAFLACLVGSTVLA